MHNVGGERLVGNRGDMREHLVAALGAGRDQRRGLDLPGQFEQRIAPRFGRVVAELLVLHVPDRVGTGNREGRIAPDDDGRDRGVGEEAARERERLQRSLVDRTPIMIDEHEHRSAHASPSS